MTSDLRSLVNATPSSTNGADARSSTPLQTAVTREPGLPCGNYNSKRVNILHQDDHGMQNVAGTHFADREQAAGRVEQPSTGRGCPNGCAVGRNVGAVPDPLAVALIKSDGRNIGEQLFQRQYPTSRISPLTFKR